MSLADGSAWILLLLWNQQMRAYQPILALNSKLGLCLASPECRESLASML